MSPVILTGDMAVFVVDKFCSLGNMLSFDANTDDDINASIDSASQSFGSLIRCLWDNHCV